jgi:hypothetical protein
MAWLHPWGLAALISVPIIIALFALRPSRRRHELPSTALWHEAIRQTRDGSGLTRLLANLSLAALILAAILASVALADPRWFTQTRAATDVVVVIDVSASMQAGSGGNSTLSRAIDEAKRHIDGLPFGGRVLIMSSGRHPRLLSSFDDNVNGARLTLDRLEGTDESGDPVAALKLAHSLLPDRDGGEVIFITDGAFSQGHLNRFPATKLVNVSGEQLSNIAISAFDVRVEIGSQDRYQVLITVGNFSDEPVAVPIVIGSGAQQLSSVKTEVAPWDSTTVVVPMSGGMPDSIYARLEVTDSLSADNLAFAISRADRELRVALYSPGSFYLESVLAALPNVVVYRRDAQALGAFGDLHDGANEVTGQDFDVAIFDRMEPKLMPSGNYMLIDTGAPGAPFERGQEIRIVELSGRDEGPLGQMIDVDALRIDAATLAHPHAGATGVRPLLWSSAGPVALTVLNSTHRIVHLGFDPARSNFPLQAAFALFFQESLNWLAPLRPVYGATHSGAGEPQFLALPGASKLLVIDAPGGKRHELGTVGRVFRFDKASNVGLYRYSAGRYRGEFAINLTDPEESDLRSRATQAAVANGNSQVAGAAAIESVLWPLAVALMLLALCAEWMLVLRGRNRA